MIEVGIAPRYLVKQRIFEPATKASRTRIDSPEELCIALVGPERAIGEKIIRAAMAGKLALPVLPEHAARAMQVASNPDSSFQDFEQLIRNNPAMAARLLKMANSPLYGIAREITSIRQAMLILGTQVLSQMLMQLVVENNVATDPQDRVALATEHQHALAIGHFSALLAGELGHGSPEAFLAGLLHDFGRLVFPAILKSLHLDPNPVARRNVAEVLHGPLGAFMAQSWNLPIVVEEAATRHHDFFFNAVGRPYSQIGHIVACAERLACNYGLDFGEPLAGCCDRNADIGDDPAMVALNMPPSLFSGLLRKADTLAVRLGSDGPISLHAA